MQEASCRVMYPSPSESYSLNLGTSCALLPQRHTARGNKFIFIHFIRDRINSNLLLFCVHLGIALAQAIPPIAIHIFAERSVCLSSVTFVHFA